MFLKIITALNYDKDGLDAYRIISDIHDLEVSDVWIGPHKDGPPLMERIWFDKEHDKTNPPNEHQLFVFCYRKNGEYKEIATNLPAYLMNENGQTIERFNPISRVA
jgi:hypothetical protein